MQSKVHVHPFPVGDWTSRPTLTGSPPERPGGVGHRVLAGRIDEQVGSGRAVALITPSTCCQISGAGPSDWSEKGNPAILYTMPGQHASL